VESRNNGRSPALAFDFLLLTFNLPTFKGEIRQLKSQESRTHGSIAGQFAFNGRDHARFAKAERVLPGCFRFDRRSDPSQLSPRGLGCFPNRNRRPRRGGHQGVRLRTPNSGGSAHTAHSEGVFRK